MKKRFLLLFLSGVSLALFSQTKADADFYTVQPIAERTVFYNLSDTGLFLPISWGLDLAWLSEENIRRGVGFMGKDRIDVVRTSYTPTEALVNGGLTSAQRNTLNQRISIIRNQLNYMNTKLVLNCDHPSVDNYYIDHPEHWAALIDTTAKLYQARGCSIISVSPFNEPDYGWGQGSSQAGIRSDFYAIAGLLQANPYFENIRICGANTLNCDQALPWYNALKDRLDEGNTHQLAGSFNNYAAFFKAVRANGHHATADELHNVMEAMVGVEYGMQTGIWWGTAEYARGEFVKASDGHRLGYAEHRDHWTASSVYRSPEGKVQAFMGSSERQAETTTYRFVSQDRDVFYDGHGPQREYVMEMPGGTGYQKGQTNAERVISITYGEDIQPVMDGGVYTIVNRLSNKVLEIQSGSISSGTNVRQANNEHRPYQQWKVMPVKPSEVVGDFSYYSIVSNAASLSLDVLNWSLEPNGNIIVYNLAMGNNQQWYLEYAGDGWFYIRSRHSTKCLEVANALSGANVYQGNFDGAENQQWRFIPITSIAECVAPSAPNGLEATAQSASVHLQWQEVTQSDVAGYHVYRSESAGGPYYTIARNLTTTYYTDNKTIPGITYYYVVRSVDKSLNRSERSQEVSAAVSGEKAMTAYFPFNGNTVDSTSNAYMSFPYQASYTQANVGTKSLYFNGDSYLQLPTCLINSDEMTLSAWVYCQHVMSPEIHLFDFAFDKDNYMYFAPRSTGGKCVFGMVKDGVEQRLVSDYLPSYKWTHVSITMDQKEVKLYVNGILQISSSEITIRPSDIRPFMNYLARSESVSEFFKGRVDDLKVFNKALTDNEVAKEASLPESLESSTTESFSVLQPMPYILQIRYAGTLSSSSLKLYSSEGKQLSIRTIRPQEELEWDLSEYPSGFYLLRLVNEKECFSRKIVITR